ncbi:MAG: gluconate 2-dehydrogenase subunit 3 family protein [Ardenticatenaceae bacterium]|nr:gluconate 2-dehydrogenase subunit 3 family protein [Ardenticatenaceae bacterium]
MSDEKIPTEKPQSEEKPTGHEVTLLLMSRRGFLRAAGFAVAATGLGVVTGCDTPPAEESTGALPTETVPVRAQYPEVPYAPIVPPPADVLVFFSPHEAQTVEALTARILPGTPDDPGAREAGIANYIDKLMGFNEGFAEPTYRQAPYAQTYEGDTPPDQASPSNQYQTVWVSKDEIDRYGFQSLLTPREIYRAGLKSVDSFANQTAGSNFVDLSEDQQDQILEAMSKGEASGFDNPSAKDFFARLRDDTINGMFADPAYGGNRDMVGWKLIGYPGAQRAYTPHDIHTEGPVRPPQSLAMMHQFHPGQLANSHVAVPVSGTEEQRPEH